MTMPQTAQPSGLGDGCVGHLRHRLLLLILTDDLDEGRVGLEGRDLMALSSSHSRL